MFNNNNPPRTCAILLSLSFSISFFIFVLCRGVHFLRATNPREKVLHRKIRCNLQAVCTRSVDICSSTYIHPFLKLQTNENERGWKGQKIIYPGQHIARSVYATTSALALQRKRGTSNVCDAVWDVLKTIRMLHVCFELLTQLIPL